MRPHGHAVAAEPAPAAKPATPGKPGASGNDTAPPEISAMNPADGSTIDTTTHMFSAVVTDTVSGVRSVTFVITFPGGTQTQSFAASPNGDTWSVSIDGLTDGAWSWQVSARDNVKRGGGNAATSPSASFTVDNGGGGGGGGGDVTDNAVWTDTDCTNDPLGCWSPSFGVVGADWTTSTFPDNIPWDYGYYVVADSGAHQGAGPKLAGTSALCVFEAATTTPFGGITDRGAIPGSC